MKRFVILFLFLLFAAAAPAFPQCAPLSGLSQLQFFGNDGTPLISGVLYVFAPGSSTQAPSYSDSACQILNTNPITFGSGARATIWSPSGSTNKLVLCAANDGPTCAPADTIWTADNLPAAASTGSGSSSAPFITSSASPATSGVLRLASGDTTCWRNASGSTNLCLNKDVNDIFAFPTSLKLPAVVAPTGQSGFGIWWFDNTANRLKMSNNGGIAAQFVASGNDIDTTDAVKDVHFGSTQIPFSSTAPTTNQCLQFNGTSIVGLPCTGVSEATWSASNGNSPGTFVVNALMGGTVLPSAHTLLRYTIFLSAQISSCSPSPVWAFKDITSSTVLASLTVANSTTLIDSGALSVSMTAGDEFAFIDTTAGSGCTGGSSGWTATVVFK